MDHRTAGVLTRAHLTCHCVLIGTESRLVLLDTGFGLRDVADPHGRLSEFFLSLVKPEFREEMTAVRQIERLGFDARDVRDIVLTHLDFDHAGGLDDFPEARVHLLEPERRHAMAQSTWLDRQRFRPQQWSSRDRWRTYAAERGESWFDFVGVQRPDGLPPERLRCRSSGTPWAMRASRSRATPAGLCWRVTPTSTTPRWTSTGRGARRACASIKR
jgi:glyoxylase-like metal-dependent hydrolase (beta-lactamase superfamily II)